MEIPSKTRIPTFRFSKSVWESVVCTSLCLLCSLPLACLPGSAKGNSPYARQVWKKVEAKDFTGAIALADQLVPEHPTDAQLLYARSTACQITKRMSEAVKDMKAAVALEPKNSLYQDTLAVDLLWAQKVPEAVAAAHAALKMDPKCKYSPTVIAHGLAAEKQYAKAILAFDVATEAWPEFVGAIAGERIGCLQALKRDAEVDGYLSKMEQRFPKDPAIRELAKRCKSGGPMRKIQQGIMKGDWQGVLATVDAARKEDPGGDYNSAETAAFGGMVQFCRDSNKLSRLVIEMETRVKKNPELYLPLCTAHLALEQQNEALPCINTFLKLHPENWLAHLERAECINRDGSIAEVQKELDTALKLAPADRDRATIILKKAAMYRSRAMYKEAVIWYDKAIASEPHKQKYFALMQLADCCERMKQYDRANVALTAYLGTGFDKVAVQERGDNSFLAGHYEDALKDADILLAKRPDSIGAVMLKANSLNKLKRDRDALATLNQFIRQGSEVAEIFKLRADIRESLGDRKGAAEDRKKWKELEIRP